VRALTTAIGYSVYTNVPITQASVGAWANESIVQWLQKEMQPLLSEWKWDAKKQLEVRWRSTTRVAL
jgi:hypothetical protein